MTTRDALVRASADLIAEQGTAAFSLRKVAERVGIKAPSIYVHFDDKEALLVEAGRYAAQVLGAFLHGECQGRGARTRLLAMAMGYLRFAQAHPSLFALLFMELPSARHHLDAPPAPGSPYRLLLERSADFLGSERDQAEFLSFGIWSLVHGAAVLRQTHLRDFSGPIVDGTRHNLERLLDGWSPLNPAPRSRRAPRLKGGVS